MAEKKTISYLNRNYQDYKQALIDFSKKYYPELEMNYNDASVGSWLIDINADIADNLSYHIDRVFQETNIDSASETGSLYALARNNGFKVPGPKGAMAEVEFSCTLPIKGDIGPDYDYAPIIRKGTRLTAGSQNFELLDDVDFSEQFDSRGNPDRTILPNLNSNSIVVSYRVTKLAVVVAGESKIFKKTVGNSDVYPFMEIVLPDEDAMNVESIVVREGTNLYINPTYGEFYSTTQDIECENDNAIKTRRFFEVESLAQQKIWEVADGEKNGGHKYAYDVCDENHATYCVTKGEWKPVTNKFITEFTDRGYLKIIFGAGVDPNNDEVDISEGKPFSQFLISRIIKNESLGYLPRPNSTIFVLYRVGGGKKSNVAKGAINHISYLNCEIGGDNVSLRDAVKKSISVVSTTPSVSGKDRPTADELRYLIKYNSGSKNRCVTVKDYVARTLQMPPKFGTPFRVSCNEENNKIMLYLLGLNSKGQLDDTLPTVLAENVRDYLSEYRMVNDYIEIKSGKIINLGFTVDVFIDKSYNKADVMAGIVEVITDYMDINKHNMGDDLFIGDIKKEISKVDGVLNLIDLKVYNLFGGNYSKSRTTQETGQVFEWRDLGNYSEIDLEASDYIVYSNNDSMLEVKDVNNDIIIRCKIR